MFAFLDDTAEGLASNSKQKNRKMPKYEYSTRKFKKLADLNDHIILLNDHVQRNNLDLKIEDLFNQKITIETFEECLFALQYLEEVDFKDVWTTYSHVFIQGEVQEAPQDLDYDNYKLFSFLQV